MGALGGLLIGALVSGFMLAIFMANSGCAWDNAKKWIEANGLGEGKGKNTKFHVAAIVGDTVGDPFKDTSGPSLDILIKLMTMMSILFAPIYPKEAFDEDWWWVGFIIFFLFMSLVISMWVWMRKTGFGKLTKESNTVESNLGDYMDAKSASQEDDSPDETTKEAGALDAALSNGQMTASLDSDAQISDLKRQLEEAQKEVSDLKKEMEMMKSADGDKNE